MHIVYTETRMPWEDTQQKKQGFTVLEILVVVAILALFAVITIIAVKNVQSKGRDAKRLADMQQLEKSIYIYFENTGSFPANFGTGGYGEGACGYDLSATDENGNGIYFLDALLTEGVISQGIIDPVNTVDSGDPCTGHVYRYYGALTSDIYQTTYGCSQPFFVLGATDMETSSGTHPDSPGWSCGTTDWQSQFEWVTGGFMPS